MTTTFHLRRIPRLTLLAALPLVLGGCAYLPSLPSLPSLQSGESFLGVITPYRMDIVQGNVVTQEQAARVQPGMNRNQVRDLLGSPMLTDPFHADRWDYIFTIRRQGTPPQRRQVVAFFKGDVLERLDAQDLPTERDFVATISRPLEVKRRHEITLTDAQIAALPKPPAPQPEPGVPMGAVRTYPPLEP
ncbi:MAG TPA: outer membrane protein assembly factor BamE [Aquabacterium sp.]|nr:outer membrane protein assembly factor BamE [Aquabacterium sp.]